MMNETPNLPPDPPPPPRLSIPPDQRSGVLAAILLLAIVAIAAGAYFLTRKETPPKATQPAKEHVDKKLVDVIQKCMYEGGIAIRQLDGSVVCLDKAAVKWVNREVGEVK
jgi:hypothetical protein